MGSGVVVLGEEGGGGGGRGMGLVGRDGVEAYGYHVVPRGLGLGGGGVVLFVGRRRRGGYLESLGGVAA